MSKISHQHWQQAKEVFEGALELPESERAAFLDRACGGDQVLRDEVDSLLQAYRDAGSFMESPAVASAAESLIGEDKLHLVGRRVKHYEILSLIGEGGMGEVYLAKDTILGRRVALKLLPQYVVNDPDRLRRFKQEARAASTLSHPNVCVIHEIGETDDGRPFIAMEFVEGLTLRERMNSRTMKLGDVLDIAIQVADALAAAHEAGVVHRDIKPENIMIREDGYVKVLDFGLAKLSKTGNRETSTTMSTFLVSTPGMVMGTVAYMSPEQARGVAVDSRTDVWSLGVLLYEMVSGHAPFVGSTPTDTIIAIVEKEQPALSQHIENVPGELERIVRKALRKDREERYQLVKEFAIDLRSLRRDLEFDSALERSIVPDIAARKSGEQLTTTGKAAPATDEHGASVTAAAQVVSPRRRALQFVSIGLAGVLLLAGAFGVYKLINRPDARKEPLPFQRTNVTKLTTNGSAQLTAISYDGKYAAYTTAEGGKQSLWLRQVAIASTVQLVPPRDGRYLGLAFSPDGNYVYYGYASSNRNDAGEIFRIPILGIGVGPTKINPQDGPSSQSHDGKQVAFIRYDRPNQTDKLVITNADGSNERVIAERKWPDHLGWDWDSRPLWIADDQTLAIALVRSDSPSQHQGTVNYRVSIYEKDLASGAEHVTALAPARFDNVGHVSLLPGASGVIMAAKAFGSSFLQIWLLMRDGSKRTITNDLSDYGELSMTADGKAFVTVQMQTLSRIWLAPKGDSSKATPLTPGMSRYFDLCWAPDGKVIYASDASGSADIYEMGSDGGGRKQLTAEAGRNYGPAISPDGRFIAFHSNRTGLFQIWRMDRDGSNPKQLTFGNTESNWAIFSPDGKWIVYEHYDAGTGGSLWKVPVDGGTPEQITSGFAIRPTVSPDGKWVAFWHNEGQDSSRWELGVAPFGSNGPTKTFEVAPSVQVRWDVLLRWSPDSRSVTYVDHGKGIDNLWAQPIDGGAPKQLTNFYDSRIFSFDWLPNGNLVASRGELTSDVVLISDADR